jgi:hypothetical protein
MTSVQNFITFLSKHAINQPIITATMVLGMLCMSFTTAVFALSLSLSFFSLSLLVFM